MNISYKKNCNRFSFEIVRNKVRHERRFKTLEEAIEYKKNWLN